MITHKLIYESALVHTVDQSTVYIVCIDANASIGGNIVIIAELA